MKKIPAFANATCLYMRYYAYAQNTTSFRRITRFLYLLINYHTASLVAGVTTNKSEPLILLSRHGIHKPPSLYKIRDA